LERPDLTASAPSPSTASVNISQIFTATISQTYNQDTDHFFQISTDPNMTNGMLIIDKGLTDMVHLQNGGSTTIATSHLFTTAGTYYIRACADKADRDSSGLIAESDESNNC